MTARFEWQTEYDQPLSAEAPLLTGRADTRLRLRCAGLALALPGRGGGPRGTDADGGVEITRHVQLELGGLPLPVAVEETVRYRRRSATVSYPDDLALAMARLHCLRALEAEWPGAEIVAQAERVQMTSGSLHYTVTYTLLDDIVDI